VITGALLAFIAMAAFSGRASAASQPSIEAQVTSDTIGLGEQTTFSVVIQNAEGGQLTQPNFGDLLVGEPQRSQQSSIMIMNGQTQTTTSVVYTWNVEAPREGKYKIGPARLVLRGQTIESRPVEITCSGQAAPRPAPRSRRPMSLFDPFDSPDDFSGFAPPKHGDSDIFLRAVADKTEVFLGEQVTLSIYAYASSPISTVQNMSVPKLDGFWAEDVETPTQLAGERRMVNNVPYNVYMLRKRALFPIRSGELTVDSFEADIVQGIPMFFGAAPDAVKRKSQPLKLTVKPLPVGAPSTFETSNVGSYQLSAQASPTTTQLGQPIQLKVVLDGIGNIRNVQVPKPQLPDGLKTYDPTVTEKVRTSGGRFGGSRTIEWVVIPNRTGDFTLPSIEVPLFDPSKGSYSTARTNPIPIHVTPADNAPTTNSSGPVSAPVATNVLAGGVRPIRVVTDVTPPSPPLWKRTVFWPLAGAPAVAWVVILGGSLFTSTLRRRDPKKLKERRAHSEASRRLKTARTLLEKNDSVGFHAEVTRSLQQFVEDKTGVLAAGLTREELGKALIERGYAAASVSGLVQVFERCETARFSPQGGSRSEMEKLFAEASSTLDALAGKPS
jgi:hypothetical protein